MHNVKEGNLREDVEGYIYICLLYAGDLSWWWNWTCGEHLWHDATGSGPQGFILEVEPDVFT